MSYDLAVWDGPRPESDAAAAETYELVMSRFESEDNPAEPTPRIRAYVEALLSRWPDLDADAGEESPWADCPLMSNADGDAVYFSMVWTRAEEDSEFAAEVAAQHGLVCFDPQAESLRPPVGSAAGGSSRRWFRRRRS
ncbi:hypothetical protein [Nocardioides rubriscoriae]|uniref:hypothetical protein n=1 Tax=Nocardioides rubriscoriae TaxID=642762 RepID=UPI0011E05848|nr:hypothetical protein [Nocardioides rubriscoriae]